MREMDFFRTIIGEDAGLGGVELQGYDREAYGRIKAGWDRVAKPLDSLGVFEDLLSRIGAIQGRETPDLSKPRLLVCCADNGIVEEGVTQSGQEVTAICAGSIAGGRSSAAIMAKQAGVEILTVDVGIHASQKIAHVRNEKIRAGTRNFRKEPAMTREEALQAIRVGMKLVRESKEQGFGILGMGEMGIGNTTTSSAVTAALLGLPVEEVTGRGAGLSDQGLARKKAVIREALQKYGFTREEAANREGEAALEVLRCLGGLDIACMAGICLGGALCHVPVVLDGFISLAAALAACRMIPAVKEYLIPSHSGKEPAMRRLEEEMGLQPPLYAHMALGEGTGAILMLQLLKTVNAVYEESVCFEGAGIDPYKRYQEPGRVLE